MPCTDRSPRDWQQLTDSSAGVVILLPINERMLWIRLTQGFRSPGAGRSRNSERGHLQMLAFVVYEYKNVGRWAHALLL